MRVALFLVAVAIAAAGGFFAWQYSSKPAPVQTAASPPPPAIAPAMDAPAADMAAATPPSVQDTPPRPGKHKQASAAADKTPAPSSGTGALSESLPRGMRAAAVPAGALAEFILPGDRVDVIVAHNVEQEAMEWKSGPDAAPLATVRPTISEVLIANAQVIAVQNAAQPPSIVLSLNPYEAQKLHLADNLGTVSVALRSPKDKSRGGLRAGVTTSHYLTQLRWDDGRPGFVRVIRGVEQASPVIDLQSPKINHKAQANRMTEEEESDTNEGEQN